MAPNKNPDEESIYSIGACARISGLSSHTLRKWESRYGAVKPKRTEGGTRRYTASDLERLSLLGALVEAGHSIGTIARLSTVELAQLASTIRPVHQVEAAIRAVVVGPSLSEDFERHAGHMPGLRIVASHADTGELAPADADVLVFEATSLTTRTASEVDRLRRDSGVAHVLLFYAFGSLTLAEKLSDARTAVARMPVVYGEVERLVRALLRSPVAPSGPGSDIPRYQLGRETLARFARRADALECECPRHTAEIVRMLSEFEDYSLECEQEQPEDAAVHHMLRRNAAQARALMEEALVELARVEDIPLEVDKPT
jgi:DNA-binding transcriptional MerR regulator